MLYGEELVAALMALPPEKLKGLFEGLIEYKYSDCLEGDLDQLLNEVT